MNESLGKLYIVTVSSGEGDLWLHAYRVNSDRGFVMR